MSKIRILAENVANRIAAGEVVERPASVVKELLENALDAGARSIRVEVESGGKQMIRVIDDGTGMNHDDALLAFERHATSKLRTAEDLLSIGTLGFRGEALASIASISRLLLETRTVDEEQGTRVEFAGGKLVGVKPTGVPTGTSLSVADIFYCVPARRKFLKSESTELGHIASLVTHYALAHPNRQFVLKTPTQEILSCSPVEQLSERVYQIFGRQALDELTEIPPNEAPMRSVMAETALEAGDHTSTIRVTGFTSRPEIQRPNRNGIYIFVNRRLVRDRLLLHAIGEAYRNIVPPGVFPFVLLFLDLPYQEVDVNVHPAKIEVRFRHPSFVHDFTRDALRQALSIARPIPGFPVRAAAAAAGSANLPTSTANVVSSGVLGQEILLTSDANLEPTRAEIPMGLGPGAETLDSGAGVAESLRLSNGYYRPIPHRLAFEPGTTMSFPPPGRTALPTVGTEDPADGCKPPSDTLEAPAMLPSSGEILDLKPLGQVSSSFIVAVNREGLWIVDQHVAHERILFEQHLRARREGALGGQRMLMPLIVELDPQQLVTFDQIGDELRANGFDADRMGGRSIAIQATPAGITSADAEKLLCEILNGFLLEDQTISIDLLQSKIAASTACHAAIKVNTPLDSAKMEWLLSELAKTEYPMSCPHGRPVVLRYSVREIERAFKRI